MPANLTSLDSKRITVIGGTDGIGLSAVCAFVGAGARVFAVGLKSDASPPIAQALVIISAVPG